MWGKIYNSIVDAFDFNQATLSGCIDIICIPQDDKGTLKSTPFHVRFGKAKLLRSREKVVNITVNGDEVDIRMKLGAEGEAYFVQETEEEIDDKNWETSPLSSPTASPRSFPEYTEVAPLLKLDDSSPPLSSDKLLDSQNISDINTLKSSRYHELSWTWGDLPRKHFIGDNELESNEIFASSIEANEKSTFLSNKFLGINSDKDLEITLSLCGHLLQDDISDQEQSNMFVTNIVTKDMIENNPLIWFDPNLIVRFKKGPPYYHWRIAYPLLFSYFAFGQSPSIETIFKILDTSILTQKDETWRNCIPYPSLTQTDSLKFETISPSSENLNFKSSEQILSSTLPTPQNTTSFSSTGVVESFQEISSYITNRKRFRKSLRPNSIQLNALNLKPGANSITFSVTSSLQGTKTISSTIYLWPRNPKIIISDVDGTITRSDVLGHLMPIVGRDWSHDGVAEFFTKIRQNGYYILYLTSRAIGLADSTRDYLFGLTQNEKAKLPDGPIILSPDRFFLSLKREVIDRTPYLFKIAALRDIRDLFDSNHLPFYAGFGNREADHRAYVHAGIPESKVFIIDRRGIIHQVNTTYAKTYETLSELAEHMFPPLNSQMYQLDSDNDDKYNNFNFWKHFDYEAE